MKNGKVELQLPDCKSGCVPSGNTNATQRGIHWEVSEEKGYTYNGAKFFEGKSGLLNSYTEAMRAMNADFADNFKNGAIDPQTNYIFVLKYSGRAMERDAAGFMPRGGQFGYIFLSNIGRNEAGNVIAHELGHGLWKLRHTFDGAYGKTAEATQGTTDNLMDYTGGAHLAKWQWDVMSEPAIFDGVMDGDEEGMVNKSVHAYVMPNGKIYDYLTLNTKEESGKVTKMVSRMINNESYCLTAVKYDGITYNWDYGKGGYTNGENVLYGHANNDPLAGNRVNIAISTGDGCTHKYAVISWDENKDTYKDYESINTALFEAAQGLTWYYDLFDVFAQNAQCESFLNQAFGEGMSCETNEDIKMSDQKLNEIYSNIAIEKESDIAVAINSSVCMITLRKEENFDKKHAVFKKITTQKVLNMNSLVSALKLMSSYRKDEYKQLIQTLRENRVGNRTLYDHLIIEFNKQIFTAFDKFVNYLSSNSGSHAPLYSLDAEKERYFLDAMTYIIMSTNDSDIQWEFINKVVNLSLNEVGDIAFEDLQKRVIKNVLVQVQENDDNIFSHFIDMLSSSELFKKIDDYRTLYQIAKLKSLYRELFASFTPDDGSVSGFFSVANGIYKDSWLKGKYTPAAMTESQVSEPIILVWGRYLADNDLKQLETAIEIERFLSLFKSEFEKYIKSEGKYSIPFWNSLKLDNKDCKEISKIAEQLAKESPKSMSRIDSSIRKKVLRYFFETICANNYKEKLTDKANDFDHYPLTKLLASFDGDPSVFVDVIDKITIEKIYGSLSGESLSSFLNTLGDLLISTNEKIAIKQNDFFSGSKLIVDKSKLIQLESDLLTLKNTSGSVSGNNIKMKDKKLNYKQEVLVYVAGDFEFLGTKYKEGALLQLPLVKAFALSNTNDNIVYKKSAWIAVDVVLLAVGVGEAKMIFTAGNMVRKTLLIADITGSITGIVIQGIDNNTLSEDTRFKLQMISLAMCVPNALTSFPKVRSWTDRLDGYSSMSKAEKEIMETVIENTINANRVNDITTIKNVLSKKYGQQIIDDFAENSEMLIKLANDENLAETWNALYKAGRSILRKNPETLGKASTLMKNNKYGFTSEKMEAFARLHAETGADCGECINSFEKMLDNLLGLENKLDNADDFTKIIDDLTATHANRTNNFRAADWAVEVANKPNIKGKIKAFDYKPDGESFSIDIVTEWERKSYYIECKNYLGAQNFLKESGNNFVSQLVGRLSIQTLDDIGQVTFYFHPHYRRNLKADVIEALKVKKVLLEPLIKNGRLQKLLPDEIINTSDDFINILNTKNNVYNALFK